MDYKLKALLIQASRNLSKRWKEKHLAKQKCKSGPSMYQCEHCHIHIYEGSRELDKIKPLVKDGGVIAGKMEMDHKIPVIPKEGFKSGLNITGGRKISLFDWNEYYQRLFCEKDNYQGLCHDCHQIKSHNED